MLAKRNQIFKEEIAKIKDEIKEGMMQAPQSARAGNVPVRLHVLFKQLTESKMNWRELIRKYKSTIKNDYTFSRP